MIADIGKEFEVGQILRFMRFAEQRQFICHSLKLQKKYSFRFEFNIIIAIYRCTVIFNVSWYEDYKDPR